MTKKDYIVIARAVNNSTVRINSNKPYVNKNLLMYELCQVFQDDNSNFDPDRFTTACGLNSPVLDQELKA